MAIVLGPRTGPAKRSVVDGCAAMRERGNGAGRLLVDFGAWVGFGMAMKHFAIAAALGLAGIVGAAPAGARDLPDARPNQARASDVSAQSRYRRAPPRIQINPGRLLYRRCVGGYELQHRPSGTVLFPYRHCWWVRG
jgi:hypothetical protein